MNRHTLTASLLLATSGALAQVDPPSTYHGHRAVQVTARNARELMTIRTLADEVLTCSGSGIGTFDIRVTPKRYAALLVAGVPCKVLIDDIQVHMDKIWADDARVRESEVFTDDPTWFNTYRTLPEFEARMQLYATNYPAIATISSVSTTIQGRQTKMVRITGPGSTTNRPAVIVQGNQHAREWITPHSVMYMIDRFCETYGVDSRNTNIVNNIDLYFIVTANPDGYVYSHDQNHPSWRKNRRTNTGTGCTGTTGVDLNRNWGFQWGFDNEGSSPTCSSDTYRGTAAFSEPELAGLKSLVDSLAAQGRLKAYWDVHTNGQAILSPWGYTTSPAPAQLPLMNTLGQLIHNGMLSIRGTDYPYGQGSVLLYVANGVTRDYLYGVHGAMAWSIELGGNSFQPATSEILPICQEAFAGFLPLAEYFIIPPAPCYSNCDGSTGNPSLTSNDFQCFLNKFAAGNTYANCDGSSGNPILTANDFQCFLNKFAGGCS